MSSWLLVLCVGFVGGLLLTLPSTADAAYELAYSKSPDRSNAAPWRAPPSRGGYIYLLAPRARALGGPFLAGQRRYERHAEPG